MFCIALSTLTLLVAIDRGGLRWWALYAVATAAVLYTHYTGVFALGAQTVWAAWRYPQLLRPLAAATGGAAVLFLPWLPQVGSKGQLDNPFYGQLTVTNIGRTGGLGLSRISPAVSGLAGGRGHPATIATSSGAAREPGGAAVSRTRQKVDLRRGLEDPAACRAGGGSAGRRCSASR